MYGACYSYLILIKLELYRKSFVTYSNIKFHENPSSWNRDVPCGHGQTDMTKPLATFSNFAKNA